MQPSPRSEGFSRGFLLWRGLRPSATISSSTGLVPCTGPLSLRGKMGRTRLHAPRGGQGARAVFEDAHGRPAIKHARGTHSQTRARPVEAGGGQQGDGHHLPFFVEGTPHERFFGAILLQRTNSTKVDRTTFAKVDRITFAKVDRTAE